MGARRSTAVARLGVLVIGAAVVAAGCSSGSGDTSPTTTGAATAGSSTTAPAVAGDAVWQVGTITALSAGGYEGVAPVADLASHGDLGLGTFDALDGELVMVDGVVWRVPTDGTPVEPAEGATTPFAQVTAFDADRALEVPAGTTCEGLPDWLATELGDDAAAPLLALRAEGRFEALTTRSVPAQSAPFPPLSDVVADQQVTFDLPGSTAVLVGFRTGDVLESVSPPGIHLHGLADDGRAGGHVLSCTVAEATVEVDVVSGLDLAFTP